MKPIQAFPLAVAGCTTYKPPHRLAGTAGLNTKVICKPIASDVSDFFLCVPQEFEYPYQAPPIPPQLLAWSSNEKPKLPSWVAKLHFFPVGLLFNV